VKKSETKKGRRRRGASTRSLIPSAWQLRVDRVKVFVGSAPLQLKERKDTPSVHRILLFNGTGI